jgi:hypothetical protein
VRSEFASKRDRRLELAIALRSTSNGGTLPAVPTGRVLAFCALTLLGCGRGDKETGDRCGADDECARGYCVLGVDGEEATCTHSCASTEECPRGWACSGVTQRNVLVCSRGAPTPFGVGARE